MTLVPEGGEGGGGRRAAGHTGPALEVGIILYTDGLFRYFVAHLGQCHKMQYGILPVRYVGV